MDLTVADFEKLDMELEPRDADRDRKQNRAWFVPVPFYVMRF